MSEQKAETPIIVENGRARWCIDPSRHVQFGHSFTKSGGYLVIVKFEDQKRFNSFPASHAHKLAAALTKEGKANGLIIATHLTISAAECDRLNDVWQRMGRPARPLGCLPVEGSA